jgi:hypothetical protein
LIMMERSGLSDSDVRPNKSQPTLVDASCFAGRFTSLGPAWLI